MLLAAHVQGEDKWLEAPHNQWVLAGEDISASTGFSVFGVFDGHGGKQVATVGCPRLLATIFALLVKNLSPNRRERALQSQLGSSYS